MIRAIGVDGALLKTAHESKAGKMPGILIILRDPAHVIGPSVKDTLGNALKQGLRDQEVEMPLASKRRSTAAAAFRLSTAAGGFRLSSSASEQLATDRSIT